jgi:polyhydroxyalkanoate synthesis repressor PhaR
LRGGGPGWSNPHRMETVKEVAGSGEKPRRVIKRYSNRKLYDTKDSRYVTLQQIGEMVRAGEEVQIIDNATKEDKTEVTLALIISEDLKSQPRSVPLGTLRDLIQERGERLLSQLREGPIGRLIPGVGEPGAPGAAPVPGATPPVAEAAAPPAAPPSNPSAEGEKPAGAKARITEMVESSKQTIEQWQHTIDERIGAILPGVGHFRELQAEVTRLTQRVAELEAHLHGGAAPSAPTAVPTVTNGEKPAGEGAADEGSAK